MGVASTAVHDEIRVTPCVLPVRGLPAWDRSGHRPHVSRSIDAWLPVKVSTGVTSAPVGVTT